MRFDDGYGVIPKKLDYLLVAPMPLMPLSCLIQYEPPMELLVQLMEKSLEVLPE